MAENKIRTKMRKNRVTIDDKYMGPEPAFSPGETGEGVAKRSSLWTQGAHWYNYYYKAKDYVPTVLQFAEDVYGYKKKDIQSLKKLSDWDLVGNVGKVAKLHYRGYEYTPDEIKRFGELFKDKVSRSKLLVAKVKEEAENKPKAPSVQERTKQKILDTICDDWDRVVDGWFEGDFKQSIDAFKLFKQYGLKGSAINMFKALVEQEYQPVKDAYDKSCDQAVEAYSHIKRTDQNKMIKVMETIFSDLDKLKVANKAAKVPRAKKPKASDIQVRKLKYKVEDIDDKITSINPVMIPGKEVLFVYNTKNRKLTEYKTNSTKGFEVSGTTIKNICEKSRTTTLRKPDEILPLVLSKTVNQIEKLVWQTITTKVSVPNGRINADCVLLRVL